MVDDPNKNVSAFPAPPMQYVTLYSDENIKKGRTLKPPPPIKDSYMMFGAPFRADDQIIRALEHQNLQRLYPQNYDHKRELKKLNYSILVNFLDLLDVLIKAPDSQKRCEKIDDLTLLFIHMHHLINEFRPHQARETLRVMLDVQKNHRIDTLDRFKRHLLLVREMIQQAVQALPAEDSLQQQQPIFQSDIAIVRLDSMSKCESMNDQTLLKHQTSEDSRTTTTTDNNSSNVQSQHEILDRIMCDIVDSLN